MTTGFLSSDDTTLDTPYSRAIELVTRQWSGKHQRVVVGITLIRMLWIDGNAHLPGDVRIDDNAHDRVTNNDHVQAMVQTAAARRCQPRLLAVDCRDARLEHLNLVRSLHWQWLTHLNAHRLVDPDGSATRPIRDGVIPAAGAVVHLTGYGVITVVAMTTPAGGRDDGATSDLAMGADQCAAFARSRWRSEASRRGSTQDCGSDRAQHRAARARWNPIGLALRAFLRLAWHRLRTGTSWCAANAAGVREAIRAYLAHPRYTQLSTA